MNNEHPWQSAKDQFDNYLMPKLKAKGMKIGEDARNGNAIAKKIISTYTLLHRSFDPMNVILLEEALKEYENGEKQ
jgi:hypothetical protein